jgi:dienelactone hydrolase
MSNLGDVRRCAGLTSAVDNPADTEAHQRYERVYEEALPLYQQGRYADALARVEAGGTDFGVWSSDITHVRACLQALVGRPEQALATLEAGLAEGQWWSPHMLLDDDYLAALTELDGFDEVVSEARARVDAFNSTGSAVPPIVRRPEGTASGLLVALHGGDGRAGRVADMFAPAAERGYLVAAPTSSYRATPSRAGWVDRTRTAADIGRALATLPQPERELPVVVSGFSAGGRAALLWALHSDPVPVAGAVLVAPAIRPELVPEELPDHRVPGVILLGSADPFAEDVRAAAKRLEALGVRLHVIDGLGHDAPADFATRLLAELDRLDLIR